jgi:hypothetical protein
MELASPLTQLPGYGILENAEHYKSQLSRKQGLIREVATS